MDSTNVYQVSGVLGKGRDGNGSGSGRAITRPSAKRLRVEIHTRTHTGG
jgi:hypothetical protein